MNSINKPHHSDETPPMGLEDLLKRKLRIAAIIACEGNRTACAKMLGISNNCVRGFIRKYRAEGEVLPDPYRELPSVPLVTREMEELTRKVLEF